MPSLHLENVVKRYGAATGVPGAGNEALKAVSFIIPEGQIVALIGPSGAGKSTLIRCVNRLVEPTTGRILWGDVDLAALDRGELRKMRRKIGMIFQEFALIDRLTVMENILSGRLGYVGFWQSWRRNFPQSDIDEAFRLLDRVGLAGYEDKRADALSGGQRQRVGIARALMQNPELLLVDEPTASLDPKTSRQIMRLIAELCRERKLTAIVNIHDVPLAKMFAEQIIGLREGRVVFNGTPEELTGEALTSIYGAEDWEEAGQRALMKFVHHAADAPKVDQERLAGLR
ncbi:MAG: phosphonate ABC transporter ATP-binding protein [Rhodospirillaceae bacterium]|nr:phosphonate ABC transporter ATP-binding protein [Rhodospirillaceae bacterium]